VVCNDELDDERMMVRHTGHPASLPPPPPLSLSLSLNKLFWRPIVTNKTDQVRSAPTFNPFQRMEVWRKEAALKKLSLHTHLFSLHAGAFYMTLVLHHLLQHQAIASICSQGRQSNCCIDCWYMLETPSQL